MTTTPIEANMRVWLMALVTPPIPAFYQHLQDDPPDTYAYFRRAGDDSLDTIDGSGEPDIIYWDVELYSQSVSDHVALCKAIRAFRDYRGALGDGYVEDIQVTDQQDDYEPSANADSLPPYLGAFRVITTGYE